MTQLCRARCSLDAACLSTQPAALRRRTGLAAPALVDSAECRGQVIASAFSACFLRKLPYGTLLSEAREGEAECAICQQAVRKPVLVPCGHLFCDGCLRRWLESRHAPIDGTCPLCRSVVQPAHLRFSLDGSAWLLPHWF